jgi:lipopolysaccharide biosynthesis glycosyltransferase
MSVDQKLNKLDITKPDKENTGIAKLVPGLEYNSIILSPARKMRTQHAWTVLIMGDMHYMLGAVVMANSLKRTNTKYDITCMVETNTSQKIISYLKYYFDRVFQIEILNYPSKPLPTRKQNEVYGPWMSKSYTKWVAMSLTDYTKICVIDADLIVTNNIDHIFDLPAPVGVFSNHWFDTVYPNPDKKKTGNYYMDIKPGELISPYVINCALHNNGFLLSAHLTVLETSANDFNEFKNCMSLITHKNPFGFNNSSCHDEQSICYFQSLIKNRSWTCLKQPYNVIPWKLKETISRNCKFRPYLIHFNMTPKPWKDPDSKWLDTDIWWAFAQNTPHIDKLFDACQLHMRSSINHGCSFCMIVEKQTGHFISCPPHTVLICPMLHKSI